MKRLVIATTILVSLALLSACAPLAEGDVADLISTEIPAPEFVKDMLTALTSELQIDAKEVKLVSAEKVQWRDSCMGVQRKGMMCLEVITPGYLIVFETSKGIYEAHTNEDGTAYLFVAQEQSPTATP